MITMSMNVQYIYHMLDAWTWIIDRALIYSMRHAMPVDTIPFT